MKTHENTLVFFFFFFLSIILLPFLFFSLLSSFLPISIFLFSFSFRFSFFCYALTQGGSFSRRGEPCNGNEESGKGSRVSNPRGLGAFICIRFILYGQPLRPVHTSSSIFSLLTRSNSFFFFPFFFFFFFFFSFLLLLLLFLSTLSRHTRERGEGKGPG